MQSYLKSSFFLLFYSFIGIHCIAQVNDPFPKITKQVLKTPHSLDREINALSSYLTQNCNSEEEKTWAIYCWVIRNIEYDNEAYKKGKRRINKNNQDILQRGKAVCFGYASLFKAMCEKVGINCEIISGYSKGTLTAQPKMNRADHAWNAVQIDGDWFLLDATWGSGILNARNDFVLSFNEGFFLTTPEKFIVNHLPLLPMWQLLDCPIQADDFEKNAEYIYTIASKDSTCFNFKDSIDLYLNTPLAEQKLKEAIVAYQFNPTKGNANDLGHAKLDFAGRLTDQANQIRNPDDLSPYLELQQKAIKACQEASDLVEFYDWQQELYANLLINHAVGLYIDSTNIKDPLLLKKEYELILSYLKKAKSLLALLPDNSLRGQNLQTCTDYEKSIQEELNTRFK